MATEEIYIKTIHSALQLWPKHLTRPIRSVSEISFSSMLVSHRKNPWNQTLGNFWENSILIFCNVKNLPIFANFEPFFPSNSILLIFWIEWMFPKCSQILVQDFRHQNFGIWIILGWVMAILVKNIGKITKLLCKGAKYLIFPFSSHQYYSIVHFTTTLSSPTSFGNPSLSASPAHLSPLP